jgi:hypothetical protein
MALRSVLYTSLVSAALMVGCTFAQDDDAAVDTASSIRPAICHAPCLADDPSGRGDPCWCHRGVDEPAPAPPPPSPPTGSGCPGGRHCI